MGQLHTHTNESSVPNHQIVGNLEDLLRTTLIRKLGNCKMVSDDQFKKLIELSDNQSDRIEKSKVYNENNCSIFERKLPDEIFVHILSFLKNWEIVKLRRVCKNFANYWIGNIQLWKGRSFGGDGIEPFMYFKPILKTPRKTILFYFTQFIPSILNSFLNCTNSGDTFMVCKFVVTGSEKCGKSELVKRITVSGHKFKTKYTPTKIVEMGVNVYQCNNKQVVKMQVWDFSGNPLYESFHGSVIKNSRIAFFCFDLSDENSFTIMKEKVGRFLNESQSNKLKKESKCLIIIGMKRDLGRLISLTRIGDYLSEIVPVTENGIPLDRMFVQYFELSSKTDSKYCLAFPFLFGLVIGEDSMLKDSRNSH